MIEKKLIDNLDVKDKKGEILLKILNYLFKYQLNCNGSIEIA